MLQSGSRLELLMRNEPTMKGMICRACGYSIFVIPGFTSHWASDTVLVCTVLLFFGRDALAFAQYVQVEYVFHKEYRAENCADCFRCSGARQCTLRRADTPSVFMRIRRAQNTALHCTMQCRRCNEISTHTNWAFFAAMAECQVRDAWSGFTESFSNAKYFRYNHWENI